MAATVGKFFSACFAKNRLISRTVRVCSTLQIKQFRQPKFRHLNLVEEINDNSISSRESPFSHHGSHQQTGSHRLLYAALAFSLFGFGRKENPFNLLIAKARIAEEKTQLQEADKLYHEALKVLDEQFKDKSVPESDFIMKQTVIFDSLANIYLVQGRVREAEELLKAVLQGLFALGRPQNDNTILEISMKLANIFALQNREPEARAGFRYCFRQVTEKLETIGQDMDTKALLGLICDNYGRYLLSLENYVKAEYFLMKALEISREVYGDASDETIIIMNNLATLFVSQEDYIKGREHLETAMRLATENEGNNFDVLSAVYCNLANVLHHEGRESDAFLALKEAENLAKIAKNAEVLKEVEDCRKRMEKKKVVEQ